MDGDDLQDWFIWGLLATLCVGLAVMGVLSLIAVIVEVLRAVRRRRAGSPALSIEQLLGSIPDVPYGRLPRQDDDSRSSIGNSCVICVTQYEAGERCSVLPACGHMFHKDCVGKWLHKHSTCPLCRAKILVLPQGNGNAADSMV